MKDQEDKIGHLFITGVTRFTKTSIFSELNHVFDLTFDPNFAAVCGLTQEELDNLIALDRGRVRDALVENGTMPPGSTDYDLRQLLKDWYDGYTWNVRTTIYSPWSIVNFFQTAEIDNYWFESGSPNFLVKLFKSGRVTFDLTKKIPDITKSHCFIDDTRKLNAEALLLQTGYLTIKEIITGPHNIVSYRLGLPNLEVAASFGPLMLPIDKPENAILATKLAVEFRDCLRNVDEAGAEKSFSQYLGQFPFDLHDTKEKIYHVLFVSAMYLSGQPCDPQERTAEGILDVHLKGKGDDDIIVELKYYKEKPKTAPGGDPGPESKEDVEPEEVEPEDEVEPEEEIGPEKMARLRSRMATRATNALTQIDELYAKKYERGPGRLIKVGLVVAKRVQVLVRFKILDREPI